MRKAIIVDKVLSIVNMITVVVWIYILSFAKQSLIYEFVDYRIVICTIFLLYKIPKAYIDRLCTCKRCGHKRSREEFLQKTDDWLYYASSVAFLETDMN